jgi:XisH protein
VLVEQNIGRTLYLAVPLRTYQSIFQSELGAILLKNKLVRLLVFEEIEEVIVEWVPD